MKTDYHSYVTGPDQSIRDAMTQMTRAKKGALAIVDMDNKLVGVITDGDIRRALLAGSLMTAPIGVFANTNPFFAATEAEALELAVQHQLVLIPVANQFLFVEGLLVLEEHGYVFCRPNTAPLQLKEHEILVVIPARGGSKRIPHKNLQRLNGQTLVARAVTAALEAFPDSVVLVSTDDEVIANEARNFGAIVPWLRPSNLAKDDTSTFEVLDHVGKWVVANAEKAPEILILLEPTAPLRRPFHLREAYNLFKDRNCDSVVSVNEIPHIFNPAEQLIIQNEKLVPFDQSKSLYTRTPRLDQKKTFVQNGLVYVLKLSNIFVHRNLYGNVCVPYITDSKYFSDIDEPHDLLLAELKLKQL